jgi:hypothetical protein
MATESKMDAVRDALQHLGRKAKPLEIQDYVRTHLSVEMSPSMISNYKSYLKKKGGRLGRGGRKAKAAASAPAAAPAVTEGGFTVEDIRLVKKLADQIGAEKVRDLAEVLAK